MSTRVREYVRVHVCDAFVYACLYLHPACARVCTCVTLAVAVCVRVQCVRMHVCVHMASCACVCVCVRAAVRVLCTW